METFKFIPDYEVVRFDGRVETVVYKGTVNGEGEILSIKTKEYKDNRISLGQPYVFFGEWGQYRDKRTGKTSKQFQAKFYCGDDQDSVDAIVGLIELTAKRKFPGDIAYRAFMEWGVRACNWVTKNPYQLMKFSGVGFKIADALYLSLGGSPSAMKRQVHCGLYALENTRGSIWHPPKVFEDAIRSSIGSATPDPAKALKIAMRAGLVCRTWSDDAGERTILNPKHEWLATERAARTEQIVASLVTEAQSEECKWPAVSDKWGLSTHQQYELANATEQNIGLLLGGGGTGKTFVVACLIKEILKKRLAAKESILVLGPTGRAAVRSTETLRGLGIQVTAKTIHSALGWTGGGFRHRRDDPLDADFIIVDETSMCDQIIMWHLLWARRPGTPILFVGDPYQLPPVGAGSPFRDFQEIIEKGMLTETHRNCGTIAQMTQDIRRQKDLIIRETSLDRINLRHAECPNNYVHIECDTPDSQITSMTSAINWLEDEFDPWDIQIIGIVNNDSPVSVSKLNSLLQDRFNPGATEAGTPFRQYDKVMNTENGWLVPDRSYSDVPYDKDAITRDGLVYVANGELGKVVAIRNKFLVVEMKSPWRRVMVPRFKISDESEEGFTGTKFVLGYAITTHKSQGSQSPAIIAMIDEYPGAQRLADQSLYYTQLTRTESVCVSIGKFEVLQRACKRLNVENRKTFLVDRYREMNWSREHVNS